MRKTATAETVDRDRLLEFLRPRHQAILLTQRQDGSPQASPVTTGVDGQGRLVTSTYPEEEYRRAMSVQGKVILRLTIDRWGPIASGGFPTRLADTESEPDA